MKLAATIARSLQADMQSELRDIERAVTTGTRDAGRDLKTELRRQVGSSGLGQRLANSWRDRHYPNQRLDAASMVYTKAPQIIRAFDEGAVVRSKRGRFLAIPTENAPRKGPDGRRIRPSTFPEHRFGPLRFVPRPSGPSLLVVDGLQASFSRKSGDLRGFRRATDRARRSGQGLATVVMFLLVPQVKLRKRLDVAQAAERWLACHPDVSVNSRGSDGTNQNDARRLIAQSYAGGLPDPFGAGSSYSNTRGMKMLVWTNPP